VKDRRKKIRKRFLSKKKKQATAHSYSFFLPLEMEKIKTAARQHIDKAAHNVKIEL
jgi:hypothetical protein